MSIANRLQRLERRLAGSAPGGLPRFSEFLAGHGLDWPALDIEQRLLAKAHFFCAAGGHCWNDIVSFATNARCLTHPDGSCPGLIWDQPEVPPVSRDWPPDHWAHDLQLTSHAGEREDTP